MIICDRVTSRTARLNSSAFYICGGRLGAVDAAWSGRCISSELRRELLVFIEDLARLSHRFFDKPPLRAAEPVKVPQIRHWDNQIEGEILVSRSLMDETSAEKYGVEVVETQEKPTIEEVIFEGVYADTIKSVKWPLLREAHLYGIEFQLYDPRDWENHSGSGPRMSFVFLSHQCPDLNGQLVTVEDHDECQFYDSEIIKQADWFLTRPSMTLKYYLEKWFDYLMGWIKYFFMPNLYYWRRHDVASYEDLRPRLDMLLAEASDKISLRKAVFEDILERFEYEAVEWWKAFYGDAQNRTEAPRPLKYGPDVWWNAVQGAEHGERPVPPLRKTEDGDQDVQGKKQESTQDSGREELPTDPDKLEELLRQQAAELRARGFPVTDDMRMDMDAFKGVVYPAEEVERDKRAVRRAKEIEAETPWDIGSIRGKLGKEKGGVPMTGVFAHIVACLEEQGWKFRIDDEKQVVKMEVKPSDVPLKVRVGWGEKTQHISFMVRDLVTIPEPYRDAACVLANMINWQFRIANFEIDMEDGETVVTLVFPVKDGTLGQEQIRFGLGVVLHMAERFYPAFQKLLWAGLSPREALATVDE